MGRPKGSRNGFRLSDQPEYKERRAQQSQAAGRRYRDRRRALLAELKDHPCAQCGGRFHPAAMDFHHRDASAKDLKYTAWSYVLSQEKLLEEVAKCDVVCANCHRILHAEERERVRTQEVMLLEEPIGVAT